MRFAALFIWLALPIAAYATHHAYGTPHVIASYTFDDNGDPYNPFADRYYRTCTLIGWGWHRVTVPAKAGHCPWVRFFHQRSDQ